MPTDFNSDYVQIGTDAAENLTGDSSANYIEGEDGADTLDANGGNDQVDGGAGHDVLYGDNGNDSLFGNDGSDTIFGGNGDDVLHGGGGLTATATTGSVDALSDIDYTVTSSKPSINGSTDTDFRIAASSGQSIKTVKFKSWDNGVDNDVWLDLTTFADDFKLKFTKGDANDEVVLYGDGVNIEYGSTKKSGKSSYDGKGSISYTGADGNRHNISFHVDEDIDFRIEAATADTTYTVSEAGDTDTGADVLDGGDGNDSLIGGGGADSLSGGSGNDVLSGNSGADTLTGGAGSDTLNGGSGNDVIEVGSGDSVSGGAADDTITADPTLVDENASANAAIYVDGGSAGSDADTLDLTAYDFYRNLSQSDDTGGGSTSGTIDVQNSGGDWTTITFVDIESLLLPTLLDVTPPVVTLTALGTVGDTTPTISGTVDDATATVVVLLDGTSYTAVNNGDGSWVLDGASVSELEYDTYSITVTATDAASNAATASGSFVVEDQVPPVVTLTALGTVTDTTPTISGTVDDATATVVVQLDGASYTAVNNGDGTWVLDGAAITELGNGAYTATVTATDGAGNQDTASDSFVVDSDIVNGTSGNDLIRVGYVDTDGDVVGDSGTNVIEAASGDDKIFVGAATDTIRGQDGNDNIRAGGGNDVLSGGAGNDLLDGGTGADTMTGGAGNDAYFLDDAGDVISEDSNAGHDRVKSTVTHVLGTHFEELWLMGAGDLDGTGNEANNFMRGSDGANTLSAQGGQDTILGRDGADVILAGAGDDMAKGNQENDTLDGGAGNDKLYGDNGDDSLTGGEGDDRLYGGAGNDEQQGGAGNDRLNGGAGADTLTGGTGNDVYRIDENDVITEAADAGYDKVVLYSTGGTYNIAANIEKVAVKKADVQSETTVYGNDDGQVIIVRGSADVYAGDGDDHITLGHQMGQLGLANGGAGNDKLHGSLRADALHGGDGNDKLISGGNDSGTDETLAGGGGDDIIFCDTGVQRVVFYAGDDADIVKSFDAAEDMLCFGGGLAKADVTITETDRGQLFSYGDGDEVHVIGADLTINDLNFIV